MLTASARDHVEFTFDSGPLPARILGNDADVAIGPAVVGRNAATPLMGSGMFIGNLTALAPKTLINSMTVR